MKLSFSDSELADIKDSFEGRFRTSAAIASRAEAILAARAARRLKAQEERTPKARDARKKRRDAFRARYNAVITGMEDVRNKAATFDKIVEMLDHTEIGNKVLGECTKTDLTREAAKLEGTAAEISERAGFYLALANLVGNRTVREAADRAKVIELLAKTFRSE